MNDQGTNSATGEWATYWPIWTTYPTPLNVCPCCGRCPVCGRQEKELRDYYPFWQIPFGGTQVTSVSY